ncbi:MAG: DUF2155 domain-containing protein [Alphaproteobacteria bacterium]|nr:DUF2155 domain-containing protein [Alphaproteobacteria bacterium]
MRPVRNTFLATVLAVAQTHAQAQPQTQAPSTARTPTHVVAVLQGLDKITARVSRFDAPIDQPVRFGTLLITVRACIKRPPEEPPETAAFLEIDEVRADGNSAATKRVFSGWMFASSPAISALEDPVYDVNVLDCKTDTAAPPSSPATK